MCYRFFFKVVVYCIRNNIKNKTLKFILFAIYSICQSMLTLPLCSFMDINSGALERNLNKSNCIIIWKYMYIINSKKSEK